MGYIDGLKLIGSKYHYRFRFNGQLLRGTTRCSTLPDAQKWLRHFRARLVFEGVGIREIPTLMELLESWMETAGATNQAGQITSMKAAMLMHCKKLLPLPLDQLTTERVQATLQLYLATRGNGPGRQRHTPGGANALRLRLNTLMGFAIRCGYISRKPYSVKKFRTQQQPRPIVKAGKAKDFLEALERIGRSSDRKLSVCLMLGLGLRESESLGLRWEFIDWDQGSLFVGRMLNGSFVTKGGEARKLSIPAWLLQRLLARWEEAKKPTRGLVFPGLQRSPESSGVCSPKVGHLLLVSPVSAN